MNSKKNLKRNLLICLLAGSAVMYTLPLHAATSVIGNGTLPSGGQFFDGNKFTQGTVIENGHNFKGIGSITKPNDLTMNVHQNNQNAVIKWDSFNVGGSATVNFKGPQVEGGYNTLNYVNAGGSMSQIYGTINANNNGNIFIVNPAGVQIGNSAQINVGSLHVSNKNLDNINWKEINNKNPNINDIMSQGTTGNAALMSLGNINATKVTFEGDGRIVIDSERLLNADGNSKNTDFEVHTDDAGNVLIGYDAYDEIVYADDNITIAYDKGTYKGKDKTFTDNVFVNGQKPKDDVKGYMWVKDVNQLQAINTNLGGNYALRNSIDATSTDNGGEGFKPIGLDEIGKLKDNGFTGKFDGIDYNIFGLTINNNYTNVGLFGGTNGATINNVTLVGGSIIGGAHVGAVVGSALNGTVITNVVNSASVSGSDNTAGDNIGGVVGVAYNSTITNAVNTGAIDGKNNNVGGLVGLLENGSTLNGNSYNLGDVSGDGYNVGGLVGRAVTSTIGDGTNLVYNRLDVTGAYNVGGIVGNMEGTTVQNAENSGNVTATGYTDGTYSYHSAHHNAVKDETVNIANVGGIAGKADDTADNKSKIENVTNSGDISSNKQTDNDYYDAGNVGGIVGSAVNTNITNATNKENDVRGAHNVGGVAGYFGGSATITGGINDGGDIMATGARDANGFVRETVRPVGDANESFIIGNIGGVVGYLDGDNVYVTGSANRGTVHTDEPADPAHVEAWQKAANVGGVVGKIDRGTPNTLDGLNEGNEKAAVTNSYNTGDVLGYTGVGGVIGMMYNGAVSGSYNLGTVNTTRQVDRSGGSNIDPLNMGGIVGDTTEETNAKAIIYDVYNKGQIGDEEFNYYARHVGGIVGRLSGYVEKAYNTGDIYNNDTVVGGIAGWWYSGTIKNAFNTGNITAITATELQVGGLVGAAGANANSLTNAYNLGTIRGYQQANNQAIYLGGIVGKAAKLSIDNVYTLGNLYAGRGSNTYTKVDNGVGYIYGGNSTATVSKAYYITAEDSEFSYAAETGAEIINFNNRYDKEFYTNFGFNTEGYEGSDQNKGYVSADGVWRIYDGSTTPILNAFLPNTEKYFGNTIQNPDAMNNIDSIQYGTAYDPLLTIINATNDLNFDWNELDIGGAGSLVVYGGGLTLDNVSTSNATGGSSYYGGVLYSDGALTIKGNENENLGFGSASELYGSEVTIKADGTVTIYGDVTATGNANDNDTTGNVTTGNVTINAGDVNVYGTLTSATIGKDVSISGIASQANGQLNYTGVNNPKVTMPHIGDRFTYTTQDSTVDGNIIINAGTKLNDEVTIGSGNVNLYYGNKQEGLITAGGNLDVTGTGNVYVDSDLDIGGNLTLTGNGENSEVVLDLTNIGQVQAKNELAENPNSNVTALDKFHDFMHQFGSQFGDDNRQIMLNAKISGDAKLTIDMWDKTQNNGQGGYNLNKYDQNTGHDLVTELNNLNINADIKTNNGTIGNVTTAKPITYIWVSDGDQLQAINNNGVNGLSYNYALKNDINASDVTGYEAIGTNSANGFIGTFDGRGNRIIGLDTTKSSTGNGNTLTNAGIFSTIGEGGTVKNVNIYSGNFEGTNTAGSVAGMNSGRIENVTGFGNTVTVTGASGNAGGIVGVNNGKSDFAASDSGASTLTGNGIYDVQNVGSVIAGGNKVVAGGLVGLNAGALGNSYSDSAVTVKPGVTLDKDTTVLGGVVGVNTENGDVRYVDSLGITNGGTNSSNVGGIIGVNKGNMYSGYNESIVSGKNNVGGIIGDNSSTVANVVNATSVTGKDKDKDNVSEYVGGLIGSNNGDVNNGRNNGTITGTKYVGGMVGNNAAGSTLTNLVNDSSAAITGTQYVGGIAGNNAGEIKANNSNLINRGSITGNQYVGGVAGMNTGEIRNTVNSVVLNATGNDAKYFGGVAGYNDGTIGTVTNTSTIDVTAQDGTLVGGIIGYNAENGTLEGEIVNEGNISGESEVGGIIGENINQSILNNENKPRLTISNKGNVSATDGGAAGIFYDNKSVIDNVDLVNEGTVTGGAGANSITGGLFGVNSGNITNSTLTNNGEVTGGGAVGGLIGNNSGSASGSVFTNDGIVEGKFKVGGLFGINSGSFNTSSLINTVNAQVTGKQEVGGLIGDNIGNITGGRDDADSYYKYQIYSNGTINVTEEGTHIGGLFGTNNGTVKAAYNTGVINAGQSSNVGGIAGANSGTLDQVFNTVMTETGTSAITGDTNVGGLVGTNSGTLSNAYNTTAVKAENGVAGNAVGVNADTGTITNIYASNTSGKLIGNNINTAQDAIQNAYSFVKDDTSATTVLDEKVAQKAEESYGFDNKDDGTTWKFYDGYSNPLLKVFLTTLTVDSDQVDLVYNAGEQDLNIGELVGNVITAPIVKDGEEIIYNGLDAYYNTVINGSDLGESELLQNTTGQKDAGTYDNWLYSGQIASGSKDGSGFNPNNLGYDIVYTKNDSGETGVEIGKATINIDLGKVEHTYGNADVINGTGDFKNEAGYGFNITNSNLTQEMKDELNDKGLGFVFEKDNALTDDTSGRVTEDVKDGGYTWSANFELSEELKKNYQFDDNGSATLNKADGQSIVNQAKLEISVDDAETMPGVMPGFTGKVEGLTNGDDTSLDYVFGLGANGNSIINVNGIYDNAIGIVVDGKYYELNAAWTDGLFKNYNVTYNMGTLTVDSEIMPDLPDNWPNNRWDYLFGDNPFDRNENFRERKAEVNFVDGAMEI